MTNNVNALQNENYQRLRSLKAHQQALVASTMVERMLPNYLLFSEVTEFGDANVLRNALNIVWEKQIVKNLKLSAEKQLEKIEPNVPDIADFDMFGVYPALDAVMALSCLLSGIAGSDEEAFIDVCKLSQSSVNKVVEQELASMHDSISEQMMDEHELMRYESDFLDELIVMATRYDNPGKVQVNQFKERALADGITNIAIAVGE
jgi:uncharacterized protein YjaG (DUF416 family)